jgi:glycosyltransferase involved in cell wall biosynthesis
LQEALDSIRSQTYAHIEVVVSDDASKDGTWELLERFRESVTFPVHLYKHQPRGIGANWNHTVRKAKGPYIKFLFQDDVLEPECIEKMVNFLEQNKEYGLVGCKRSFIVQGEPSQEITRWIGLYSNLQSQFSFDNEFLRMDASTFGRENFLASPQNKVGEPPTVMFRKEVLKKVAYFDESLQQILDYVFYYRVQKHFPIAILKESLVRFRIHSNQATNVNRGKKINDYEVYNQIMYKEFLPLLHPKVGLRLKKKYHPLYRIALKIKRKIYPIEK